MVIATICIAAGGNIINDIYDVDTDKINNPKRVLIGVDISEKKASNLYIIFTSIGVLAGFSLSNLIGHPSLAAVFVIIAALLYGYSVSFKTVFLLGNVVVSLLVAMVLITSIIFDLYPAIEEQITHKTLTATIILLQYALFAFSINLIREIIKDLQDINGDRKGGRNSLPIAIGRQRTVYVAFGLTVCLLVGIIYHLYMHIYSAKPLMLYFLFLIIAPLFFVLVNIWNAKKKSDFSKISTLLKIIMFLGICSLLIYPYTF
ncbi:prenyltransferase [Patiriisocius marinistellae]|uniref:Prenyltransferase n=1 Tax=Patiriisocius marinistellae TaxID=2494560 RepID=A0A5J4FVT3_9FLAO|nr:prenyltransferase [Patiriisocius marinistellae]